MRPRTALLARSLLLLFAPAAACMEIGDAPAGEAARSPPVLDVLAAPLIASIVPAADGGRGSTAAVVAGLGDDERVVELEVRGGLVELRLVDGELALDRMTIEIADVELPPAVAPRDGARLSGLRLELDGAVRAVPRLLDDEVVLAALTVAARLRWTLVKDGVEIALADVPLARLDVVIAVSRDAGAPVVRLSGGQPGSLWRWLDHLALTDLELAVVARPADVDRTDPP